MNLVWLDSINLGEEGMEEQRIAFGILILKLSLTRKQQITKCILGSRNISNL